MTDSNSLVQAAKAYLSEVRYVDTRINIKLEQIQEMRNLATRCTMAYGGVRVSHTQYTSSMEETIHKIIDVERALDAEIDRLVDLKREVQQLIEQIPDTDCRILLEMRYLRMMNFTAIGTQMSLGRSQLDRLHQKALCMAGEILGNSEEHYGKD